MGEDNDTADNTAAGPFGNRNETEVEDGTGMGSTSDAIIATAEEGNSGDGTTQSPKGYRMRHKGGKKKDKTTKGKKGKKGRKSKKKSASKKGKKDNV